MRHGPYLRLSLFLFLALLLTGCAYFNTYYNADQAYEEGLKKARESTTQQAGASEFSNCLEISSKLLQFYPDSRWVDNTILLIAKCYVQTGQYHRAIRKIDELENRFPKSKLLPEARAFRAQALLGLDRRDEARTVLASMIPENLRREVRIEYYRTWAKLYRSEKNWSRLVEVQQSLLKLAKSRVTKGEINAEIGKTYETLGQYEDAVRHYSAVRRLRPGKRIQLESELGAIDNLIRMQRFTRAASRLKRLKKDERYFDDLHRIDLREGNLLIAQGEVEAAMQSYQDMLKNHANTVSSSGAAYAIAQVYLLRLDNPDSAKVYYERCKREQGNSQWADSVAARLELVNAYSGRLREVVRLDSLIDDTAIRLIPDSAYVRSVWAQLPDLYLQARADSAHQDTLRLLQEVDSLQSAEADSTIDLATLLQRRAREDSLRIAEEEDLSRTPTRRRLFQRSRRQREKEQADSLAAAHIADSLAALVATGLRRTQDSLLVHAVLDTARWEIAVDSAAILSERDSLFRAEYEERYMLAELYLYKLEQDEKADSLIRVLVADSLLATESQAGRSLYALGTIRIARQGDSLAGSNLYHELIDRYPLTNTAGAAREWLGLPPEITVADSARVLLEIAEAARDTLWDPTAIMAAYDTVIQTFPETEQARQANVAAGLIAWEWLGNRSLATPYFEQALRFDAEHPGNALLLRLLGRTSVEVAVAEEDMEQTPEIDLAEALVDADGRYYQDAHLDLEHQLENLRQRFQQMGGRLHLQRILH